MAIVIRLFAATIPPRCNSFGYSKRDVNPVPAAIST
jgi:hypothetical protein